MGIEIENSMESLYDAKKRIPRELDERIHHCSKDGNTRMETCLYAFMLECGLDGAQIADREYLVEIFADYLMNRIPLVNLSNSQLLDLLDQMIKSGQSTPYETNGDTQ